MTKLRIALIFGGPSPEHSISLLSASNVFNALDKERYEVTLIGIDPKGRWRLEEPNCLAMESGAGAGELKVLEEGEATVAISCAEQGASLTEFGKENFQKLDCAFPILHGNLGEDGCVQGLLRAAGLAFVGPDVMASAVCMDKDIAKRVLLTHELKVAPSITTLSSSLNEEQQMALEQLGLPLFVKPANAGSSFGVSKVSARRELANAIEEALLYDSKVLVEAAIEGRELECAVLGNQNPKASAIGEVIPSSEAGFYSFEAKYVDEQGASLEIPAKLNEDQVGELQETAVKAFSALGCEGMARVDMFLTKDSEVYINEINTIPGFTNISMYPCLWRESGLEYSALLDELIQLAIERQQAREQREANFSKKL